MKITASAQCHETRLPSRSQYFENGLHVAPDLIFGEAEKNFNTQEVGALTAHAAVVYHKLYELKKNAREVCISLHQCKEAYIKAVREQDPSKKYVGWNAFCEKNFSNLGLSERNIRAAVKTGEVLLQLKEDKPQTFDAISDLSRDALFVIGSNPEVAHEVEDILTQDPAARLTAAQLRELAANLQKKEQTFDGLHAELKEAQNAKHRAEASTASMNEMVKDYEDEILRLQTLCDQSATFAISPANAPPSTKDKALTSKPNKELARMQRQITESNLALTKVKAVLAQQKDCEQVLTDLSSDMSAMLSKYSVALVAKLSQSSPSTQDKLNGVAKQLIALAAQLSSDKEAQINAK